MKTFLSLFVILILANNVSANLRIVPVTHANQKELELNFTLSFEKLTDELLLIRVTVPKEGKLKALSAPSVFIPRDAKAPWDSKVLLIDVPLANEPVLKDRYYFIVNKKQIAQTWLHLHCMPGGSSEIRYEIALDTYLPKELRAGIMEPLSFDCLPLLDIKLPPDDLRQPTLAKLKSAKVADLKAAHDAAMRYKIENGGLDARDDSKVTALFLLGQDVADFAKEGDLIWDVKITRGADRISDELWISSTTGQGKSILPQPKAILPNTKYDGKETR